MNAQPTKAFLFVTERTPISRKLQSSWIRMIEDEIEACKEYKIPHFAIPVPLEMRTDPLTEDDLQVIVEKNRKDGLLMKVVDTLEGYHLLPRNPRGCTQIIVDEIREYGGTSEVNAEELSRVEHWPEYIDMRWTQRKLNVIQMKQLPKEAGKYAIDGKVFAKQARNQRDAGHGIVMPLHEVLKAEECGLPYEGRNLLGEVSDRRLRLSKTDTLIISQPVSMSSDSQGTLEYRAWIMNNEVTVLTRYGKPEQTNVPQDVRTWARLFAEYNHVRMPPHYVVDIGRTTDRGLVLVEINSITEAGDTTKEIFRKIVTAYQTS